MPSGIVFRRVTVDDLADMVAIETASFPSPWSPSALLGELNADGSDARIACEDDGKTVGYLLVRRLVDEIHVMRIAVHQHHRRQGLAASLMQECISEARRTRARAIVLEVRPSNTAAVELYRKLGFTVLGKRLKYYPETGEDALIMGYLIEEDL